MYLFSLPISAVGNAIKLDYNNTSMTIELSEQPKMVTENGEIVLMTNSRSITVALPCKVTFVEQASSMDDNMFIRNNDENCPINVYTIDGRKIATIEKEISYLLKSGIYIINGKIFIIRQK
jgi:hypothetical protein